MFTQYMINSFFLLLFGILLPLSHSLQTFYISNDTSCASGSCDGSQSKPFPGLINGFLSIIQQANSLNDFSIDIELTSSTYVIKDSQLSVLSGSPLIPTYNGTYQLFERNISINVTKCFDSLSIKPIGCDQNLTIPCNTQVNIVMKSENFSLTVAQTMNVRNLIFQGQNLPFRHQKILNPNNSSSIDTSCLESDTIDCCTLSSMISTTSNCYMLGLDTSQRVYERLQDYQYGLFQQKHSNTVLQVMECEFILMIAIGTNSIDTYSYLFGSFIDPLVKYNSKNVVVQNLMGLSFKIMNSRFSGNYFFYGHIYYTNNNQNQSNIVIQNCSFEDYNPFAIRDLASAYNNFTVLVSNVTLMSFMQNTIKNCFMVMHLDYSTRLNMTNNTFIYNNDLQLQTVLIISSTIYIINGFNDNIFNVSQNTLKILLANPYSESLYQGVNNNSISIKDQTFNNFSNLSIINFNFYCRVYLENVNFTNTALQHSGFIVFQFESLLVVNNCSFVNLSLSVGDFIFFSNSSIVSMQNLMVMNNVISTTGSFINCKVWNCTVVIENSSFWNLITNINPAIFFLESSCVISVNMTTFINISTASQGGILYGDVWNSITFTNLLIDSINAQEGALLYIKDHSLLFLTNVTTNNCSANIAFLYYGRESQNSLYVESCLFLNSQGTALAQLQSGSILAHNCSFINLTNSGQQAALIYGGAQTVVTFENNFVQTMTLDNQGWGLIFLESQCPTTIVNSTFIYINASLGSIVYASDSNMVTILNISVSNMVSLNQGALYFESSNNATIINSVFSNIVSYTDGGVLYIGSNNVINFTMSVVYNISVTFYGAFASIQDSNNLTLSFCNISNLVAYSQGGVFYATAGNNIILLFSEIYNLVSEAGPLGAFNNQNNLFVNGSLVINSTAMRYGGLIYSFTSNILLLSNCSFVMTTSKNLAGGFYLDIFNTLTIANCSFNKFSATESGAILVTVYQNLISLNNSKFESIWINSSNDGVISRLGLSTSINITLCTFNDLYSDLENDVFYLDNLNYLLISNSNFSNIHLSSSSGFLIAGTDNLLNFQGLSIDFYKDPFNTTSSPGTGELFQLNTNNTFVQFINSVIRVSYFSVLFDLEANCVGSLSQIKVTNDSRFDLFFFMKNGSALNVSSLRSKLSSQSFSISDSTLSLVNVSMTIENTQMTSLLAISNSILHIKNCDFMVTDSISTGSFLIAVQGSTIAIRRSSFIGFKGQSPNFAGVFSATDCESFQISSSLLMFNDAGISGGGLSYVTTTNTAYSRRRRLQGLFQQITYQEQVLLFKYNVMLGNKAQNGNGGAIYINNANNGVVDMRVWLIHDRYALNKANDGGAAYINGANVLRINASDFSSNQALVQNSAASQGLRAEGGAIYFNGMDKNSELITYKSTYYENMANIGGALYLSPLNSVFLNMDCQFTDNSAQFFGSDLTTPVYRISFKPGANDIIGDTFNSSILSATINNIQSGYQYPNCLVSIIGVDKYNNIAVNTSEDFSTRVVFTEENNKFSTIIKIVFNNGAICLNQFTRTGLPIQETTQFSITFQRYDGQVDHLALTISFRDCQIGEKLTSDYQCQTCPDGTYSLVQVFTYIVDNCKDCSGLDFSCQAGGLYTPNPGFWRYTNLSSDFLSCPKPANCLGGYLVYNDSNTNPDINIAEVFGNNPQYGEQAYSGTGYCQNGYKGMLCNECDAGYGKVNAYTCLPCKSGGYAAWIIFQILFKLIILFASLHISLKTSIGLYMEDISELDVTLTNLIKIMLNHVQMLIVLFTFIDFSQIYNNIISFLLGVNSNLGESFNIECLLKTAGSDLSPLYFEFCITVLYIFPISLICFFYVRMMHRKSEKKYNKSMSFWLLFLSCILIVLQLSYFDIINVTLKLFPCFNVSDSYNPENRLVFDYSISCDDANQIIVKYAAGLPIVLGFGLGFPFILLAILKHKHANQTLKTDNSLLAIGFFFYIYEENFFFWDILQLLRKFSMTLIQILLASSFLVQNFASLEVLLVVVFAFLSLQMKLRPYLKPTFDIVNTLERSSLIALTLTFYFALYHTGLKLNETETIQADLTLFLLSLLANLAFIIYWSYIFLPQQLLSTWYKAKGLGKTLVSVCQKKKKQNLTDLKKVPSIDEQEQNKIGSDRHDFITHEAISSTVLNLEVDNHHNSKDASNRYSSSSLRNDNTFIEKPGSMNSLSMDIERKSTNSDKKSIIFSKGLKKESNSFLPLQQYSFPSIPDFEEESSDLNFLGVLNLKQMQGMLLKKTYNQFLEHMAKGMKSISMDIEDFNKINCSNKLIKAAIMMHEGKLYSDDFCEFSYKCKSFAKNTNFVKMECMILKKKIEIGVEEIKIKANTQNSCIEIIEDKEEDKKNKDDYVMSYNLLFTATHLALGDLPTIKIKLNLSKSESSEKSIKLPISINKLIEFTPISSIFNYFRAWTAISDLELFELKKTNLSYFEDLTPIKTLQLFLPHSIINEEGNHQEELLGSFEIFLLPHIEIFYRIKVVVKSKKTLIDKNGAQKKYELRVLMGMKREAQTPDIFNRKEFSKYCLRLLFCNLFAVFYGENRRILENKLETLEEEEDENNNNDFK